MPREWTCSTIMLLRVKELYSEIYSSYGKLTKRTSMLKCMLVNKYVVEGMHMVTFLRCVIANRAALIGYVLFIIALASLFHLEAVENLAMRYLQCEPTVVALVRALCGYVGLVLLIATVGGFHTYGAYCRALRIARAHNMVRCSGMYCSQVGVRLALRDFARESR